MIGIQELILVFAIILLSLRASELPGFACYPGKSAG